MKWLLDTNVLSDPLKPLPNPNVHTWMESVSINEMCISVMTLGEIRKGIEIKRRKAPGFRSDRHEEWLEGLDKRFEGRILFVTPAVADVWGQLVANHPHNEIDAILAATALVYDLTVVTRNERDMAPFGVSVFNPFEIPPPAS